MRRIWFHLGGVLLLGLAAAFAAYVAFFVTWGATKCGEDPTVASDVWSLRIQLVLVAVTLALVPVGWARLARRRAVAWRPWAAVAALIVFGTLVWVATIDSVGTWCLY
jgi:hypothetical protein